ncbi:hypothetical protein WJX64_08400 [Leifsonia sp. YIM 134122]|uniref:Flippase-like domain-containing protein n=1 Tax=Leifsonia stereocauli TaxID=3134136 RepID=A0ABU9W3I9_9MICO
MASRFAERLRARATAFTTSRPVRWVNAHRRVLAIVVLSSFFAFLVVYLALNPGLLVQAFSIGWLNISILLALYLLIVTTHFGVLETTIRLSSNRLPYREGFLLTVYSTVSNFFGPLQSGPGIRAVYLKGRIGMRFRDYTYATLYYFGAFAVINGSLLFANTAPWITVAGLVVGAAIVWGTAWKAGILDRWVWVAALGVVVVVQVLLMTIVYFVEINAVSDASYTFAQALSYSGSANLSLFVSVTPGAIGIREGFLVFAHSLHQVPLDTIVAAGIVDRAFYAVFLGALFGVSSLFHLRGIFRKDDATEE